MLCRIQIDPGDALLDLRAKLAGGHDESLPLRRWWRRVRYGAPAGVSRARGAGPRSPT